MASTVFSDDFIRTLITLVAGALIALGGARIQFQWADGRDKRKGLDDLYLRMLAVADPICAASSTLLEAIRSEDEDTKAEAKADLNRALDSWRSLNAEAFILVPEKAMEHWVNLFTAAMVLLRYEVIEDRIGGVHINRDRLLIAARTEFAGFKRVSPRIRIRRRLAIKKSMG